MENIKYYKVIAKCGHVGKRQYVPISFAVKAYSASEAAQLAKNFPRVKKQLRDSIISSKEITKDEYDELIVINENDPYLNCRCNREQKEIENFDERIVKFDIQTPYKYKRTDKKVKEYKYRKMLLHAMTY